MYGGTGAPPLLYVNSMEPKAVRAVFHFRSARRVAAVERKELNMEFAHRASILVLLAAASALAACSGGGGGGEPTQNAHLSVSLMDAPVDGVTAVNLEIKSISIKGPNGPATELPLTHSPIKVNLLGLTDKNAAILIDGAVIAPGKYEWLSMDVNADFDGVFDSSVMTASGGQEEIRVPSGRVRLVDGFEVGPNQAVKLLFDWDLRKGLVDPPGQPGFLLKPAFRMLDVTELGALRGTVALTTIVATGDPNGCAKDAADLDVGNVVYVYAGANVVPDDVDGKAPDPVAMAPATQAANGDYAFRVVLAPGDYTVAFTCQAANDDPEVDETGTADEIKFIGAVNKAVTADAEAIANF